MTDFEYYNPTRVFFGKTQLTKLPFLIPADSKVMLLYGGGSIKKNGVYDSVKKTLASYDIIEFSGIEPNPSYEICMQAVTIVKEKGIGFLLSAGGGSVIDAAKFIGAAALFKQGDPWKILSENAPIEASLPIGAILTLPATGTEMNGNSVISKKSTQEKLAFSSPLSFPTFSVLLPDAAGTLPKVQVANGIVDAFVHVIEQYLTYPSNSPIQDRFAESVLQTLIEEGPKAYANPANYEAMANLMWSATMALNGLIATGVPGDWSVHLIGHELTAYHGIDHARTLAIVLPGLWRVLRDEKKQKLLQYGERVWKVTEGTEDERLNATISRTVSFFESFGIHTHLSDYSVPRETIDKIVKRFESRKMNKFGDRGLITPEVTRRILEVQM